MEWSKIAEIKKFTSLQQVFALYGSPKFKLGTRTVYYMGDGVLLSYSLRLFKLENSSRIEYGDEGEYALNVYFFANKHELEKYFKIKQEQYDFEGDNLGNAFEIVDGIAINSTYEQVTNLLRAKLRLEYYQEGETRALNDGEFGFQNNYVMWGNYNFLFFGKTKKAKLSAFQFTFKE